MEVVPGKTGRRTTYAEVLAVREFSALLAAWLVSMLGNVLSHVALSYLIFNRTQSPFLASLALSIGWLPHLVIGTLLSSVPDRVPPRRLLVACELACAVLVALMVLPVPVPVLLLLVLLQGCVTPLFAAGRAATLPDILPGDLYVVGRTLLGLVAQVGQLVGYLLGAALLLVASPAAVLLADAATFAVSALILRLATAERRVDRLSGPRPAVARESWDGLRAMVSHRRLRALLLVGWVPPMFGVVPEAVAVPYAAVEGTGPAGASLLLAAVSAGAIVGEVAASRLLRPTARLRLMAPLALLISVPSLAFTGAPSLAVAACLLAVSGLGWAYGVGHSQRVLSDLPRSLRTRGLTVLQSGTMLSQAVGFTLGGAAAEVLAPHEVIAGAGALGLTATWLVLRALGASGSGPAPHLSLDSLKAGRRSES